MPGPSPEFLASLPPNHPLRRRFGGEEFVETPEMIQDRLIRAVQQKLDQEAQALGYDSIFTAVTYADDTNPKFAAEGTSFKAWRSAVWTYCYQVLADVQGELRTVPTAEELIAELPALTITY